MKLNTITAEELDRKFDDGEDISEYLDLSTATRPNQELKRVNVDFPLWVVNGLDRESARLGVARQSLIKMWIAEKLDQVSAAPAATRPAAPQSASLPPRSIQPAPKA